MEALPPQKMKDPVGQHLGQVPEMVKSGGDAVVHLLHGGDTEMCLLGLTFCVNDFYPNVG